MSPSSPMRLATQIAVTLSDATKNQRHHAKTGPQIADLILFGSLTESPTNRIFYLKILQTDTFIQMFRRHFLREMHLIHRLRCSEVTTWQYMEGFRTGLISTSYRQDAVPLFRLDTHCLCKFFAVTVTVVLSLIPQALDLQNDNASAHKIVCFPMKLFRPLPLTHRKGVP